MRILAVVGSPRKRGNTDLLIDAVLGGAADAGAVTEKIHLADLHIAPCDACDGCAVSGECVLGDDMIPLYDKLFTADAWVLGTPVYWWGPSAQLKVFMDRWYAFSNSQTGYVSGKRAALVAAYADADPLTPRHIVGMLADTFAYLEIDFVGQVLVSADQRGEVAGNAAALAEARALGRELAAR